MMPTREEMEATARRMEEKFHLPGFAYAVDGVVARFDGKPHGIPQGNVGQDYYHRKNCYAINCQVIANDQRLIYDIDNGWPGATNDARVWHLSEVKGYLDEDHQHHFFLMAGDSAYPISAWLVRPYTTAEAADAPNKAYFNECLSGLRTVMSEDVYGVWKSRFPCLRCLRCHLPLAQDVILATAILHNIATRWKAEEFPLGPDDLPPPDEDGENQPDQMAGAAAAPNDEWRRRDGARVRDQLMRNLGPRCC